MVERQDWGPGGEVRTAAPAITPSLAGDWGPGGEHRSALVPVTPDLPAIGQVQAEMENYSPSTKVDGDETDPLAGLSETQIEAARFRVEQLLPTLPDGFASEFDKLPANVQRRVFATLAASPHLDGERLLQKISSKLTLGEAYAFDQWLAGLPQNWFRG